MASKYDSIWDALKKHGSVRLAIPVPIQKRVIKGVIHCKDHDTARKLEMLSIRKKEKIVYECDASLVVIKLTSYMSLKNIQLTEL